MDYRDVETATLTLAGGQAEIPQLARGLLTRWRVLPTRDSRCPGNAQMDDGALRAKRTVGVGTRQMRSK